MPDLTLAHIARKRTAAEKHEAEAERLRRDIERMEAEREATERPESAA
jgi:hypothetical protein